MPTQHQSELGKQGEELACRELRRRGYAILARRYRTRHGEIDIVAMDDGVLVFVEVKARSDQRFGSPLAAVTSLKQRRLTRMALDYLARSRTAGVPCRFDVVAVDPGGGAAARRGRHRCLRRGRPLTRSDGPEEGREAARPASRRAGLMR